MQTIRAAAGDLESVSLQSAVHCLCGKKKKRNKKGTNGRCKAQVAAFERVDIPLN